MRNNNLYQTSSNHLQKNNFMKMTKTRTVTFLIMIISTCVIILSLTDAYPTTEFEGESNMTETMTEPNKSAQYVITHLVKTIEFEIGVIEDDGLSSENDTTMTAQIIDTDVKVFNVEVLKQILDGNSMEDEMSSKTPEEMGEENPVMEFSQSDENRTAKIDEN